MKYSKLLTVTLFVLVLVCLSNTTFAQCAMCQATVESNLKGGGNTGSGLNKGIMYLLAAPYLIIAGIGVLWYKKYRKKDIVIDMKAEKINLN
ncbi:hypothetical protein [Pedobacter alpinus]|uniref:Uncharacterized protein n=1 Tax=Pedobacter alpinus TaxID=1590643 RepID=A0ABW5TN62_9SPHI